MSRGGGLAMHPDLPLKILSQYFQQKEILSIGRAADHRVYLAVSLSPFRGIVVIDPPGITLWP